MAQSGGSLRGGVANLMEQPAVLMSPGIALLLPSNSACTRSKILNRLVNYLHLFFIHTATVHFDFRECSVDLKQIRSR